MMRKLLKRIALGLVFVCAGLALPASANTTFTSLYSPVKSIQTGTISVTSSTGVTATITSVTTSKAVVFWNGNINISSQLQARTCTVVLTNATTVTATCNNGTDTQTVAFTVLEYN